MRLYPRRPLVLARLPEIIIVVAARPVCRPTWNSTSPATRMPAAPGWNCVMSRAATCGDAASNRPRPCIARADSDGFTHAFATRCSTDAVHRRSTDAVEYY
ncbi:MAG: hypothetical protein Q6373_001645 [Candidatus Sigynarchaeota archaeon]